MSEIFDYCIVGSGPSGLTCSYELLKDNKKILIIERDSRSGGLAKSYNYDGNIFDTGPKRFHTDDEVVKNFLNEIMQMETIGRSTKVHFVNKYFDWPLKDQYNRYLDYPKNLFHIDLGRLREILDFLVFDK